MEKLLYVDDETINLELFKLNFRKHYEVFTTISPFETIGIIEKESIKVVVIDFKMPVINGMQLIEKIKALMPEVVCIILSGYLESEIVTDKSKVFDYIMKPFNKEEVLKILIRAFYSTKAV